MMSTVNIIQKVFFCEGCCVTDYRGAWNRMRGVDRVTSFTVYSAIQKDGFNFVRLYFLNYTWYVNDLHNI